MRTYFLAAPALAALGFAAVISASAISTPARADSACLELGRISNWKVIDSKTMIVEDDTHQKFKMSLMIACPELGFKERVGFKSFGGTELSCLTPGDYVLIRSQAMPNRCPITSIVPYTPAMESADAAAKAQQDAQQSKP
ncbi:MAG: DUF6491 family protein [Rhizomicrobium sp.]|jgi:hypothetical protein